MRHSRIIRTIGQPEGAALWSQQEDTTESVVSGLGLDREVEVHGTGGTACAKTWECEGTDGSGAGGADWVGV